MKTATTTVAILLLAGLTLFASPAAKAQDLDGYEIMKRVDERSIPTDMVSSMTMNIIDKKGRMRTRQLDSYRYEDNKALMFFTSPADVKGSSFLRLSFDDRDDDMWIYLPSFGKVRRIASHAQNGSFMGSDFTYEDLGDRKLDNYTYTLLGEEKSGDYDVWIVESVPKDGIITEYSKSVAKVWKDGYIPIHVDLYDKGGNLRKQMDVELVKVGVYWVYGKITMSNLKRNGRTEMLNENMRVDTGLDTEMFTEDRLTRVR